MSVMSVVGVGKSVPPNQVGTKFPTEKSEISTFRKVSDNNTASRGKIIYLTEDQIYEYD
jgi:hypothetical protein